MAMITVTTFVPLHNVLRPDPLKVPNRGGDSNKFPCQRLPVAIIVREVQGRAKKEGRHRKRERERRTDRRSFYIVHLESAAKGPSQFVCEQE